MAALRSVLEGVGCADVQAYLQSGNAVVSWDRPPAALEEAVRAALEDGHLARAPVMVRTATEVDRVVAGNPWADEHLPPKLLHAAFLARAADPVRVAALNHAALAPERLAVGERVAYLYYADGVQRSRLGAVDVGGGEATARNWNTVLALQWLASGAE
jgi:uncharacterized protein (DUF1697 family)